MKQDPVELITATIQEGLKDSYTVFQGLWQERDSDFEAIILALTKLCAVDTIITKGMLEAAKLSSDDVGDMKRWVAKGVMIHHLQTGFLTKGDLEKAYPGVLSTPEMDQVIFAAATTFSGQDAQELSRTLDEALGKKTKEELN